MFSSRFFWKFYISSAILVLLTGAGIAVLALDNTERALPADLVVVDEVSMLDLVLAHHLLKAVQAPTRLVFVGDPDQLPSVGPGSVLRGLNRRIVKGVPCTSIGTPAIRVSAIRGRFGCCSYGLASSSMNTCHRQCG